jgi:phospholipid N-methyltransferase
MSNQKIALETYKYFSNLEGNMHIASEFALKKIIDVIDNYKIKSVLELGLGIGSISFCVLEFAKRKTQNINYTGTEANDFCLKVLPKYLNFHFDKIQIFNNLNSVSLSKKFDLIIIDGKEENLFKVKDMISEKGIIIIEGDRVPQLEVVKSIFSKHKYVRVISNQLNRNYGPCSLYPSHYIGGIQLIFINPDLVQKINFVYYKMLTSIRYKLRSN